MTGHKPTFCGSENLKEWSAVVQSINSDDIVIGHALSLADLHVGVWDGGDAVLAVVESEGRSTIVHDGGVVVRGAQVVGVLPVEVVNIVGVDVVPVDADILVTVASGLLVLETQGMVDLVLDDAVVEAAPTVEREHLLASDSSQRREAAAFVLDADVVLLALTRLKADAGLVVVGLHGPLDLQELPRSEVAAGGVGDGHEAAGVLLPQAVGIPTVHGVSGPGKQQVSLQQHLPGVVVGGQNHGADVHLVVVYLDF